MTIQIYSSFVIRTLTFQTNNPGDSLTLSVEMVCIDGLELRNCKMIKRIFPALQESVSTLSCICQLHTTLLPCFFFFFSLAYCSLPSDQGSSLDYLMVLSLSVLALSGNMLINCYFIWYLSHYSQLQPGFTIPTSWTHEEALAPGYWSTAQSQHSGILFDSVPVIVLPLCLLLPAWSLFHSVVPIHPHLVVAWSQFISSLLPNKLFSSVPPNNLSGCNSSAMVAVAAPHIRCLTSAVLLWQCPAFCTQLLFLYVCFSCYTSRGKPGSPFVGIPVGLLGSSMLLRGNDLLVFCGHLDTFLCMGKGPLKLSEKSRLELSACEGKHDGQSSFILTK